MQISPHTQTIIDQFSLPDPGSHKGQNGKLLLIGGSELFHAASKWSLDISSKFVDMVFYTSVPENNQLVLEAKRNFWNGIVIPRQDLEHYISEADVILIGPGMTRSRKVDRRWTERLLTGGSSLAEVALDIDWNEDTYAVTNYLLARYPDKKWVIDAGALQMVEPSLLREQMILTPHPGELEQLKQAARLSAETELAAVSAALQRVALLLKGHTDQLISDGEMHHITGGSPGMTKGGTGDVLAGLVAALYATQTQAVAMSVASYANKQAAERLHQEVGPYFNASDLVEQVPAVVWQLVGSTTAF